MLPAFDEYTVAYKERSHILDPALAPEAGNGILSPAIIVDGKMTGIWKRVFTKDKVIIEKKFFRPVSKTTINTIDAAAKRYGKFVDARAVL